MLVARKHKSDKQVMQRKRSGRTVTDSIGKGRIAIACQGYGNVSIRKWYNGKKTWWTYQQQQIQLTRDDRSVSRSGKGERQRPSTDRSRRQGPGWTSSCRAPKINSPCTTRPVPPAVGTRPPEPHPVALRPMIIREDDAPRIQLAVAHRTLSVPVRPTIG